MHNLVLAIDVGTSSVKVVVFDQEGNVVQAVQKEYATFHPFPGWVEQDPYEWWNAVVQCLRELWRKGISPQHVLGIGLSGQMEICLPLDRYGRLLYPAILYSDMRALEETDYLRNEIGEEAFWEVTGNSIAPSMTVVKLLWLKRHKPELYRATRMVITGAKDYILYRLTGVYATDHTNASTTGMFNLSKRCWEGALLRAVGLSVTLLPSIFSAQERVGSINDEIARETGLPKDCPVFCGAGDAGASGYRRHQTAPCRTGSSPWRWRRNHRALAC